jgi:hypothetical protein
MRKWNCPYCGEEMLGEVNRCWNCSRRIDPPSLEPILVAEAALEPVTASIVGGDDEAAAAVTAVATLDDSEPLTPDDLTAAFAKEPPRRGSPFAAIAEVSETKPFQPRYGEGPYSQPRRIAFQASPPLMPRYPRNAAAIGGIVASIMLGLTGMLLAAFAAMGWFTAIFGILVAGIGLGLAVWGLNSDRRTLAMGSLLFCAVILMVNGYFAALEIYGYMTGNSIIGGGGW